jgi:hypothetical protein
MTSQPLKINRSRAFTLLAMTAARRIPRLPPATDPH